jgi:hypothetical protein
MRQDKAEWVADMRRDAKQDFAFRKRLAHQPELVVFEVSQPAMYKLAAGGRRGGRQVALLAEQDVDASARRIARNAATVDAAADNEEVEATAFGRDGDHYCLLAVGRRSGRWL